jgi:hypothetical protein
MVTITKPQDTTFAFDVFGRYTCNTLDEAIDSTNPNLPDQADARPFDYIVIGGGSFGAVMAARLFNWTRRIRIASWCSRPGRLSLPSTSRICPRTSALRARTVMAPSGASRGCPTVP